MGHHSGRRGIGRLLLVGALVVGFGASSSGMAAPRHRSGETITYSGKACSTGCPFYRVTIQPGGRVTTDGKDVHYVDPAVYREFAASLRAYRPPTGTKMRTSCGRREVGEAEYRIAWVGRRSVTTLERNPDCEVASNAALNSILTETWARLGVRASTMGATVAPKPALPKPHIFYF